LLSGGAAVAQEIRVEGQGGTLPPGQVEQAVEAARPALMACYQEHAPRWAGGQVTLAVRVGTDGKKKRVEVGESDLGSWAVEKCLVGVAQKLALGPAHGGEVTVRVPLAFSPSAESAPLGEGATRAAAGQLKALLRCGAARGAQVTFYVGPGGAVLSTGFARPPSEKWAECAAARAHDVVLADPLGQVLKATVTP
jgi:hypothetical protein